MGIFSFRADNSPRLYWGKKTRTVGIYSAMVKRSRLGLNYGKNLSFKKKK